MRADEKRLQAYMDAAAPWAAAWPEVARETSGQPLNRAHEIVVSRAESLLPFRVEGMAP